MTTYSEKQTFYAYRDSKGTLMTPLYDGQAPATKYLLDQLERPYWAMSPLVAASYAHLKTYHERLAHQKAHGKKMRDQARLDLKSYTLVTFCLVQFIGPQTAR